MPEAAVAVRCVQKLRGSRLLHRFGLGLPHRSPSSWQRPVLFDGHFHFPTLAATSYTSTNVLWVQDVQHSSEGLRDPQRLSKAVIANHDVRMSLKVLHHSFRRIHMILAR